MTGVQTCALPIFVWNGISYLIFISFIIKINFEFTSSCILRIIIQTVGLDRNKINNELQKIKNCFVNKKIDSEQINLLLNIKTNDDFNFLKDEAINGNKQNTNRLLAETIFLQENIVYYLNLINQRVNKLSEIQNLKEKNPNIQLWGIDTYGSVFKKYHETGVFDENEIYPYITEGIGEDILPKNVNFDIIDKFEKVTDKDAAIYQRKLAKEEGIFVGNSAGSAIKGLLQLKEELKEDDVVVVLFHDHGSRYVGKMFNDDWMRERGFLDDKKTNALDLIKDHAGKHLVTVSTENPISQAIILMNQYGISQIPVVDDKGFAGSLTDSHLFAELCKNPALNELPVKNIMQQPFPIVEGATSIEEVSKSFQNGTQAVIVKYDNDKHHIITQQDMIKAIA